MTSWAKSNPAFNWPNALCVLRALMGMTLPFFLLHPDRNFHVLAGILYFIAAWTDYFDGWIARRQGLVSDLGKILDPTTDKILVLCTLGTFSYMGYFSPWWIAPIFAREILITFCRIGWLIQGKAIAAEKLGKVKLVVQVIMLASPFLELLARDFKTLSPYSAFFQQSTFVLLILTNFLTLLSGFTFLRSNRSLLKDSEFAKFISACGVGLLPGTPGTYGSILALFLIPLLAWNAVLYVGIFVYIFWAAHRAVGRLDLSKVKDPQFVVIDEVLGMLVTFFLIPLTWKSLLLGFFLFRLFDIIKPFPCRRLEKLPGFWGITFDDLGAGVYAWLALRFVGY